MGLLGILIFVNKLMQFCNTKSSYYIGRRLFYANGSRSYYENSSFITIFYTYAFRLLVLRLQAKFNFLYKLLIDIIYVKVLAILLMLNFLRINCKYFKWIPNPIFLPISTISSFWIWSIPYNIRLFEWDVDSWGNGDNIQWFW